MANLTAPQQYLTNVAQHPDAEIKAAYNLVPQVLIDQIFAKGKVCNYLDSSLVSDAAYNGIGTSETDFFRIELTDCKITAQGDPAFKLRLTGKMDSNWNMVPMKKGALPDPSIPWIQNFKSDYYKVTAQDVANDKITQSDYDMILNYATFWSNAVAERGNAVMYTEGFKNKRLYFVARNTAFLFTFQLQIRRNPSEVLKPGTPRYTFGISECSWSNAFLLSTMEQQINSIQLATEVASAGPAPIVQRTFTPTPMNVPTQSPAADVVGAPARNPFN